MQESNRPKVENLTQDIDSLQGRPLSIPQTKLNHRKEDSTSNTQKLDESSFDISPNSSGVMLLEQIGEIKRLFEQQGRELENVGHAFTSPNQASERMREIFDSINREPSVSLLNSNYGQSMVLNFHETSRPLISPVSNDFEGSLFASSLMSMSDYQLDEMKPMMDSSLFVYFLRKKWRKWEASKRFFYMSHILGLRI
jgi:hypothetical protein